MNIGRAWGISETSSPDMIGIVVTNAPTCGLKVFQDIWDIRQSTSPYLRYSNKLDTSINRLFTNNLVALTIFTEVIGEKIYDSSSQDLYTRCRMNPAADSDNIPAPQFVDLGLFTINALDTGASLWTPATRVGRPTYVAHGSAPDHIFEKVSAVRDDVRLNSDNNYRTGFEIWRGNH